MEAGMQSVVVLLVVALLIIAAAACLAPKLKVPPLFLVGAGIGAGFLPFVPKVLIDPHLITLGLLLPLLAQRQLVARSGHSFTRLLT